MTIAAFPYQPRRGAKRQFTRKPITMLCAGLALAAPLVATAVALPDPLDDAARRFVDAEFNASGALSLVNAQYAYARGYTGKGIIVAVVDSGLHTSHPEFKGRVSPHARNFSAPQAPDDVNEYKQPDGTYDGHGTHVSGLIAAARDGRNMHGVAHDAIVLPLRVEDDDMDKVQEIFNYAIAHGAKVLNGSYGPDGSPPHTMDDGHGNKVRNPHYDPDNLPPQIVPLDEFQRTVPALRAAAQADIVMVFSAGNDYEAYQSQARHVSGESMYYLVNPDYIGGHADPDDLFFRFLDSDKSTNMYDPATYVYIPFDDPRVRDLNLSDLAGTMIAVTALDRNGVIARYSNRCGEAWLYCLSAPGGDRDPDTEPAEWDLWSTFPDPDKGFYDYMGGTSMSAPVVSGAAAVLREAFPYMTARQIIETMLTTANSSGIYADRAVYGRGLLDLRQAVQGPGEFGAQGFPSVFDVDTQGYDSVWSNGIRGSGGLTKRGGGTLTLTGANSYTGDTRIAGGKLAMNGSSPSSTFYVEAGGILSGVGIAGPSHVWGRVEPGNSVGTLTIAGDYVQYPGSTLHMELSADGSADRLDVLGHAQIMDGATLELTGVTPSNLGQSYSLLSAQGGVDGAFQTVSENYLFIDAAATNTGTQLQLTVQRNATPFAALGETRNQRAAADGADSQGQGGAAFDSLVSLQSPGAAPSMLQQLSGEIHASTVSGLLEDSSLLRSTAMFRLGAAGSAASSPSRNLPGGAIAWAQGFGAWGRQGGSKDTSTLDKRSSGVMLGVEMPMGEQSRVGGFFTYSDSSFHDDSDNRSKIDGYHATLYAGTALGGFSLRAGASHSWFDIDTRRRISFASLGRPESRHKAHSTQVFAELGYPLAADTATIEPYVGLAQVWLRNKGFSENNSPVGLTAESSTNKVGFSTLGVRGGLQLGATQEMTLHATAGLGWRHAFGDYKPTVPLRFNSGNAFTVEGAPVARNALLTELSMELHSGPNVRLGLGYVGQWSAHAHDYGVQARFSWAF